MSDERPDRCETCRWWNRERRKDDDKHGECRRFPPTVPYMEEQIIQNQFKALWPDTKPRHWCGEWQGKDNETTIKAMQGLRRLMAGKVTPDDVRDTE